MIMRKEVEKKEGVRKIQKQIERERDLQPCFYSSVIKVWLSDMRVALFVCLFPPAHTGRFPSLTLSRACKLARHDAQTETFSFCNICQHFTCRRVFRRSVSETGGFGKTHAHIFQLLTTRMLGIFNTHTHTHLAGPWCGP